MKSFKKALKIASVVVMSTAVACGVAACGGNDHTHHFAEGYSYNEQTHWHPCDAKAGCSTKYAEKEHDFVNGVCSVCDYEEGVDLGGSTGGLQPGGPSEGNNDNPGGTGTGEGNTSVVIPATPAGAVKIKEAVGDLEAAYVTWEKVTGATGYNVYYQAEGASYVKIDAPLVREYADYVRADALGLKAGKYTLKVVPVNGSSEDESKAGTASSITVLAHERAGFGFVNGSSSGAYNDDGTLKANARVVYATEQTKNTVSLNVTVGKTDTECVGIQNIITGYKKQTDSRPLAIRLIGNISDPANMPKGDLYVDAVVAGLTIEGVGNDATANGWGIVIKNSSNVEVRNIGFMNCDSSEGDNVGLQQDNNHVWVHNCDMFYGGAGSDSDQAKGDGALDTKKSTYITHSYNHFWDSGKCNLQGMKEEKTENKITYHHNWYDHSDSRHPRIRTCTVHIYNNYFDGNAKYGVGVTMGASAFVENNYFRSTSRMKPMMSSLQGTDIAHGKDGQTFSGEAGGMIKAFGNKFDGPYELLTQLTTTKDNIDCYEATTRDEKVPADYKTKSGGTTYSNFDTAADFYKYQVDTPEVAKTKVEKYAGRIGGGDFKWTFNNAVDDSDYSVNSALKAALVSYKSKLVKVYGV